MEWIDIRLFLLKLKSKPYYTTLGELVSAVETIMLEHLVKFPNGFKPEDIVEVLDALGYLKLDEFGNWIIEI